VNVEQLFQILLRILHIGSGVFWVGTAWFFFGWLEPTTKAIGPQAGPFVHHVVRQRRLARFIVAAGALNVAAGLLLYWRASAGLDPAWIGTRIGIGFTIGGIAAIVAWILGGMVIGPTVERLDEVGTAMATAGRPPTADELAQFQSLEARLHRAGQADVVLLTTAVVLMASARYLGA
jgi:hypothetical protein